jgi:tetratricopeptide (TPR) repeat protein
MKAERRHELEHNELDDLLVNAGRFLRDNGVVLGILLAVIVLAVLTYNLLIVGRPMTAPAGAWNDYFYALSDADAERELEKFVADEKGSTEPAVVWAKLSMADLELAKAAQQLFEDRKAAEESLDAAEKHYKAVEAAARTPYLLDRARVGLAEVYESQNKPDEALKYYELVLKSSPDSALAKVAARGQQRLSVEGNREFLDWFAQQEPVKKPRRVGGSPFGPGGDMPEMPGFGLPGLPSGAGLPANAGLPAGADEAPLTPGLKLPGTAAPESSTPPAAPTPPATDDTKEETSDAEPKKEEAPKTESEPKAETPPAEPKAESPAPEPDAKPADAPATPEKPAEETKSDEAKPE